MTAAHLVLHLLVALIQVLVLETPLILDVDVDVELSGLSLSQLKHTEQTCQHKLDNQVVQTETRIRPPTSSSH